MQDETCFLMCGTYLHAFNFYPAARRDDFARPRDRRARFDQERRRSRNAPLALTARGIGSTEAPMGTRSAKPNTISRALLAGFAIWLLVLQGLAFLHAHEFHANRFIENVLISAADAPGKFCRSGAEDKAPGHAHGDNADHCVCCTSYARDGSLVPLLRTPSLELPFRLGRSSFFVGNAENRNRNREPPGWASSWSSRAPPSIS